MVKSHIGSDITEKSEPLLSMVLGRFDSILGNETEEMDNTAINADREGSTSWGLLLKDTVDFLLKNQSLILDGQSQALRIDENIRVLIDVVHTKVGKEGIDDKSYLVSCTFEPLMRDGLLMESNSDGTRHSARLFIAR